MLSSLVVLRRETEVGSERLVRASTLSADSRRLLRSRPAAVRDHPRRASQYHAIHTGALSTAA